ncbi:hypothetical protein ABW20_dc0105920 [Dactylellina cionopaga]|nr:hypothetical protein ABW20_dc0105920 [Dactylellina cionopaga]
MTACSPSRRYNVILEELRLEARHRSAKNTPNTAAPPIPSQDTTADRLIAPTQPQFGQFHESQGSAIIYDANPIWSEWQTGDWLDLDGSVFGPFSETEGSPVLWFSEVHEN